MSAAPELVSGYVDEVARRLRDLPPAERAEIEADLRRHLVEIGCVTGPDCIDRLGSPERYAAELREGLGLGEYRRPRRRLPIVLIAVIVLVGSAAVIALARRDDPLPEDFQAVSGPLMSTVGGDAADTFGTDVQLVIDAGGTARYAMVLRNTSDETLDVDALGVGFVRWSANGSAVYGGEPEPTTDSTDVTMSQLWSPDVRVARLADPTDVGIDEHERTGEPFTPFRWEPGDAYLVSLSGEVAPCEPGWGRLDGFAGSIQISYDVRDSGFDIGVAPIGIDAEACD